MGVADQVDLLGAGGGQQQLNLGEQLLPPLFRTGGGRHLSHVDFGTIPAQGLGNAVEVIDPEQLVEAEQAVHQHYGVAGLGVSAGVCQHGQGAEQHQKPSLHHQHPC